MAVKTWFNVEIPKFYASVVNLLLPPEEKSKWHGMRTVGQIKREQGLVANPNTDNLYTKINREVKVKEPKRRRTVSQEEFERLVDRIMEMLEDSSYPKRKLARSKTTLRRLISRGNPDEGEYENLMGIFKAIKVGKI